MTLRCDYLVSIKRVSPHIHICSRQYGPRINERQNSCQSCNLSKSPNDPSSSLSHSYPTHRLVALSRSSPPILRSPPVFIIGTWRAFFKQVWRSHHQCLDEAATALTDQAPRHPRCIPQRARERIASWISLARLMRPSTMEQSRQCNEDK